MCSKVQEITDFMFAASAVWLRSDDFQTTPPVRCYDSLLGDNRSELYGTNEACAPVERKPRTTPAELSMSELSRILIRS